MSENSDKPASPHPRVVIGDGSVHDAFQAQVAALLKDADLSEDDRQRILTSMSCPCCGGSAQTVTVKLKD